jgi:DNA-binding MarR family transcriptional regulator
MNILHNMRAADDLLDRLFRLTIVMAEAMADDLADRGLTRARATVIAYVHAMGPVTQQTLAGALRVSPRNITGLVDALQADGLAIRDPHPTDRRALLVSLTDAGQRAATALDEDRRTFATYLFTKQRSHELRALTEQLDQLLDRLSEPAFATLRHAALERWPLPIPPRSPGTGRRERQ